MSEHETERQFKACIKAALQRHGFAPPHTPDSNITEPYTDAATDAVMRALEGGRGVERLRSRSGRAGGYTAAGRSSEKLAQRLGPARCIRVRPDTCTNVPATWVVPTV
jgi:hypothetical protein